MEVLSRPSLPERTSSLFDSGRTLWWPGSGPSPTSPIIERGRQQGFGPRAPPSPPSEMSSKNTQLPPISDLLAYSPQMPQSSPDYRNQSSTGRVDQHSHLRHHRHPSQTESAARFPPTPPSAPQHNSERAGQPPLLLQPQHDIQRIDPALFNESKQKQSSHRSPMAQRPALDTSSYPPYSSPHSASTPYPHSAPVRSQYADLSPRSAVSAAPGPYFSSDRQRTAHPTSAPSGQDASRFSMQVPTPSSSHGQSLSTGSGDDSRRPLYPNQSVESRQRPRGSFHPYDPSSASRRTSQGPESQTSGTPESPVAGPSSSTRTVSGRNYTCPSCLKEFSRPSSLKIHEHSHSGAKPFICPRPGCGKSFSVRSNMKRHERGCHLGQSGAMGQLSEDVEYGQQH